MLINISLVLVLIISVSSGARTDTVIFTLNIGLISLVGGGSNPSQNTIETYKYYM